MFLIGIDVGSTFTDLTAIDEAPGRDAAGRLVGASDVTAQTRKTLDSIVLCLAAAAARLDDVVKVTDCLKTVDDRRAVNEVRKAYFKSSKPASTLIEVSRPSPSPSWPPRAS
jgi:enamine deaminase RidA (YjgF/YER057c/UK114 family)